MRNFLIIISSILLLASCIPSRQERDRLKYDRLLEKYPEWKKTDTVFTKMDFETPAISDSADIKDSSGTKEIIKVVEKSDCPEKDKEVIRETIYKYRDRPIDTTIVTEDGKFIFKNGKVFYERPPGKITANVPIETNTYQPSPEKTWSDLVKDNFKTIIKAMAFWGFLLLILVAALIIKRVYRSE